MAYPFYPAYPYVPQYYTTQPPQNLQQMPQPAQPSTAVPAMNQSGIIWISGSQEAAMFPIAPNNAVALWDKNGKTIYLKQADATGKPTMTVFDLVERTDPAERTESVTDEYAKRGDLAAVVDALSVIRSDIDTIKGDLYGMAGRKKTVKKQETDDDE